MTYVVTYFPGSERANLRNMIDIIGEFDRLNLAADLLATPRAAGEHARALADAARNRPAQIANTAQQIADQLAAGTLTVDQAVEHVAGEQSHAAAVDAVRSTLTRAAALAEHTAFQSFAAIGDDLIGALDTEARKIAATAEKHAGKVAGIEDDAAALAAPRPTRNAWVQLADLAQRLDDLQTLADQLRTRRVSPVERHDRLEPQPDELHYSAPWALPTGQHAHPVTALIATLPAQPREATFTQWVADLDRLQAGYDAEQDRRDAERQAWHDEQARAVNGHLAHAAELADRRYAAEVANL